MDIPCPPLLRREPASRHARRGRPWLAGLVLLGVTLAWTGLAAAAGTAVYKWVDASGVTHLSSDKPPADVKFERIALASSGMSRRASSTRHTTTTATRLAAASSPDQVARRDAVISELRTRECVVALEALDRMAHGQATTAEPAERRRLQQTADRNCSSHAPRRREQEEMAARLRVAKSDSCVAARNALADMLAPGQRPRREQLEAQQEFIESHCRAPVR